MEANSQRYIYEQLKKKDLFKKKLILEFNDSSKNSFFYKRFNNDGLKSLIEY